jgi:DNA-binding IclR family transcriptional regulator
LNPGSVIERAKAITPRAGSKLARVIDLLERSEGATITHLIEATGWLPHTTRAALTGLRKRGYGVARERIDGRDSIYRIGGRATDGGDRLVVAAGVVEDHDGEPKPKANQAA